MAFLKTKSKIKHGWTVCHKRRQNEIVFQSANRPVQLISTVLILHTEFWKRACSTEMLHELPGVPFRLLTPAAKVNIKCRPAEWVLPLSNTCFFLISVHIVVLFCTFIVVFEDGFDQYFLLQVSAWLEMIANVKMTFNIWRTALFGSSLLAENQFLDT